MAIMQRFNFHQEKNDKIIFNHPHIWPWVIAIITTPISVIAWMDPKIPIFVKICMTSMPAMCLYGILLQMKLTINFNESCIDLVHGMWPNPKHYKFSFGDVKRLAIVRYSESSGSSSARLITKYGIRIRFQNHKMEYQLFSSSYETSLAKITYWSKQMGIPFEDTTTKPEREQEDV